MQKFICIALAAVLIAPASAKAEKLPETLPRTGSWDLVYDQNGCDLSAPFSDGNQQVVAKFTLLSPRRKPGITLYGKRFQSRLLKLPLKVDFGDPRVSFEADSIFGKTGDQPTVTISLNRSEAPMETGSGAALPPIDSVILTFQNKQPFRLALGSFEPALDALYRCGDNVVKEWGYDPAEQKTVTKPPEPLVPISHWLRSGDYPRVLLGNRQSGIVKFRLDVGVQGSVDGCVIISETSEQGFADITCRLISERARFSPAQNADGKPIRSYYVNSAVWISG